MKWTVLWDIDAEDGLTEMWVASLDKAAITAAANRIDAQLRKAPLAVGESRADDDRVFFEPPLGVLYTVAPDDFKVNVLRVWRTEPPFQTE